VVTSVGEGFNVDVLNKQKTRVRVNLKTSENGTAGTPDMFGSAGAT